MRDGIVQPSLSEYASPVVLVKTKDDSVRLCVDYRLLNRKIGNDRYPLPIIEDQLDLLQNARFFTTLDLKNGEKNFKRVRFESDTYSVLAYFSAINSYNSIQRTHNFKPIFYANT